MDSRSWAAVFLIAGVLLAGLAATTLSPAGDGLMWVQSEDVVEAPSGSDVVDHSDLPEPARAAVREAIRDEMTTLSTYDDHVALDALRGTTYVRVDGDVYRIRTTTADGAGGLFEGNARNLLLASGGLLMGAAVYLTDPRRHVFTTLAFPVGATAAVVGVNALAAPPGTGFVWLGNASFGLAAAVPVLAGLAVPMRDYGVAALSLATLALSVGVLRQGDALSALYPVAPLVVLAVPGLWFGVVLGRRSRPDDAPAGAAAPEP